MLMKNSEYDNLSHWFCDVGAKVSHISDHLPLDSCMDLVVNIICSISGMTFIEGNSNRVRQVTNRFPLMNSVVSKAKCPLFQNRHHIPMDSFMDL